MKKLIAIFLAFFPIFTFGQRFYLQGSDTALITAINEYRGQIGLSKMDFSSTQNELLVKKLMWMAERKMVSHGDPWDVMELTIKNLEKEKKEQGIKVWYHQTGECLTLDLFEVPFSDTSKIKSIAEKRIKDIANTAVLSWKKSAPHNSILKNEALNLEKQKVIGVGAMILDTTLYGEDPRKGVRKYAIFSIYITHVGDF